MIFERRKILFRTLQSFDILNMLFCFLLAAAIQSDIDRINFGQFLSMRIKVQNILFLLCYVLVWHTILTGFALYSSKRLSTVWNEIGDIIKATSVGTGTLFISALLFHISMISTSFLTVFWVGYNVITISSRLVLKRILRQFRLHGRNLRNIVVVGTNSRAVRFLKKLEAKSEFGYNLIGFVDNDWSKLDEFRKTGYALVSDLREFPSFLKNNVVDEVIVCLPMKSFYQKISEIVAFCEEQGIIVRFLADFFNLDVVHSKPARFDGETVVTLYAGKGNMVGNLVLVKKSIDFILSLVLIIILSPILVITALAIKMTSPGPVLFVQQRLGLNKRRIGVYKFRTMVPDAEKKQAELEQLNEVSGPVFKIMEDPRITPIGRFLRKLSIDELPQLFNVLKGDMSLVGPRPLPVRDYEGFDQDWHRRRFSVRPGITCLWQISGRSNISFDRWMELDMEYIDNWSLWLDLKILFGTIPAVLRGSGAA